MEELDYDFQLHSSREREADKNLAVRFFVMPIQNEHKSVEQGRPIFEDTEMVEIRVRGDRSNVISRPVRESDKVRFRDAWRAFKDNEKALEEGTPLKEWPIMSASLVEEMKYLGFTTVEQLAEASDLACAKVPGLQNYKQRAKVFLEFAKGNSPVEKLQAQVAEEKARADAAEAQLKDMARRIAALEDSAVQKKQVVPAKVAA